MKIELQPTYSIKGYSKLYGVDHTRIKAVSLTVNKNCSSNAINQIRKTGDHIEEFRLVKESRGYIFRETLTDHGISGHHKTMKAAIARALNYVTIHVDEEFNYTEFSDFKKIKKQHELRETGKCKHENLNYYYSCSECGLIFHPEAD
jgi:ribosomal protein S9